MPDNPRLFGTVLRTTTLAPNGAGQVVPVLAGASDPSDIPATFDGRIVWGQYLDDVKDQKDCGACYSFCITSILQDKFALFTNNEVKPVFNPLHAIMCHVSSITKQEQLLWADDTKYRQDLEYQTQQSSCQGGTLYDVARYYYRAGAVEESCVSQHTIQEYLDVTGELPLCSAVSGSLHDHCEVITSETMPRARRLWPVLNYYVLTSSTDLYTIARLMKDEIRSKGPMAIGFNVYKDFLTEYTGFGVYVPREGHAVLGGHAVKVVGWGSELLDRGTVEFWLCANSWGQSWGEKGYFRLAMANPLLQAELNHLALVPQVPGIGRYYAFEPGGSSAVRDVDNALRGAVDVNPFTLYDISTTRLIQDGKLSGSLYPAVFSKISYNLDPSLFGSSSRDTAEKTILVVFLSVIVLCALLVFFLFFAFTPNLEH